MANNKFLFRDGYTQTEMEKRTSKDHFTWGEPILRKYAESGGLDQSDFQKLGKHNTIGLLKRTLSKESYGDFLEEIFEKHGKKGDQFNIQLYKLSDYVDVDVLDEVLAEKNGDQLNNIEGFKTEEPVWFEDHKLENDGETIDILFKVRGQDQEIHADRLEFVDADTERVSKVIPRDELEGNFIRASVDYTLEVRVFPSGDLLAISNSKGDKTLRNSVIQAIKLWGVKNE
ncbi:MULTISPECIES: hypothetical protein [unclassified Haloferax]|uniref:hypothetical protein n=1 Tax=unclassified Haloferax TaxID=2625095 RepID=UPI0011C024DB|nr:MULTISPECIES: hypothetical protein [unclassified Haloferax]